MSKGEGGGQGAIKDPCEPLVGLGRSVGGGRVGVGGGTEKGGSQEGEDFLKDKVKGEEEALGGKEEGGNNPTSTILSSTTTTATTKSNSSTTLLGALGHWACRIQWSLAHGGDIVVMGGRGGMLATEASISLGVDATRGGVEEAPRGASELAGQGGVGATGGGGLGGLGGVGESREGLEDRRRGKDVTRPTLHLHLILLHLLLHHLGLLGRKGVLKRARHDSLGVNLLLATKVSVSLRALEEAGEEACRGRGRGRGRGKGCGGGNSLLSDRELGLVRKGEGGGLPGTSLASLAIEGQGEEAKGVGEGLDLLVK